MNDFIPKPIDAADLNLKLARWLPVEKINRFEESGTHGSRRPLSGGPPGSGPLPGRSASPAKQVLGLVDWKGGLARAGGDGELYRRLCRGFYEDHGDDLLKIRDALAEGKLTLAHRLAHTLKSAAALIGAEPLRQAAWGMEKDLAENKTVSGEQLEELEKNLGELWAEFEAKGYGGGKGEGPAAGDPDRDESSGSRESGTILEICDKLEPLLKSGNTASLNYLGEIKKAFPPADGEGKKLVKQIEGFDFSAALKTLGEIRGEAEKGMGKGAEGYG
jgi:HPt (histidine-containing phosphotransfer) domain-containing protein